MSERDAGKIGKWVVVAAAMLLLLAYFYNLTGWYIFDDEGEYLYQVWRMTLGEVPYRDFLTPQLPVFLYAGAAVMKLFGPSVFIMRAYSVLLSFSSGMLLLLMGKRHKGLLAGGLAMFLFLLHADVFKETRVFRNEPLFLFLTTFGIVLATWRQRNRRAWLAAAGLCFGLATMVKLFGALPIGGIGLWLIWSWLSGKISLKTFIGDSFALAIPALAVVVVVGGGFSIAVPDFLDLVLGHHLAQGSDLPIGEVLVDKASLYLEYLSIYPILVSLAIVSVIAGLARRDSRLRIAWQLPMAFAFMVLSRQLGQRHFMFLLPALTTLVAWLLADGLKGEYRRWGQAASIVALGAFIWMSGTVNFERASWVDEQTPQILDIIEQHSQADDVILADDIGLAYYARRRTTYSGAALSHGAVTSGQISGDLLIDEIGQDDVSMIIIDSSLLTGNHMVFLRDYPLFHRFLERNFDHLGRFRRDFQELDIWVRETTRPWLVEDALTIDFTDGTRFGESMTLLGATLSRQNVRPGETLEFTLFWTAEAPADNYWSVFTHLIDLEGTLIGQHDKVPYDGVYPPNRWWPGQIVDDDYAMTIPEETEVGRYYLRVGMYDWITGERLALREKDDTIIPDRERLLPITVNVVSGSE